MSDNINPADAIDLSSLKKQMTTSKRAAIGWSLQPTIFDVDNGSAGGIVPCIELGFTLNDYTDTVAVALPPDLIIGLISGLSTWLSQIQGNPMAEGKK
tara:strand:+ start:734 stop:1027 length:294 start_codon:yes stop_codon:yes gene_type:complete